MTPPDWTTQLAAAVTATLHEYGAELPDTPIAVFHVGCYPWHGAVELSLLTAEELATDPLLRAPEEVGAWQHYDFAADMESWEAATPLKRQMARDYADAPEAERPAVVAAYVRACAEAVAAPAVSDALAALNRSQGFRSSVTHPDTHREFHPLERAGE